MTNDNQREHFKDRPSGVKKDITAAYIREVHSPFVGFESLLLPADIARIQEVIRESMLNALDATVNDNATLDVFLGSFHVCQTPSDTLRAHVTRWYDTLDRMAVRNLLQKAGEMDVSKIFQEE